jgi:general secretion pathway protein N
MKKLWPLLALGVGAYLAFALYTLPASVALDRLAPYGVHAAGIEGTAWRGRAQVVQVSGIDLGRLEWDLHVLQLLTARLVTDIKLTRSDAFAQGTVAAGTGGRIVFDNLTASLPLSAIPAHVFRAGWNGTVNLKFARLALENGWPVEATGSFDAVDLVNPRQRGAAMGSYRVEFPAAGAPADAGTLVGALSDQGGPLEVAGTLTLRPDRSYLIDAQVAARPDAPPNLAKGLEILGPPDAQGRRPFTTEGTF